MYRLEHIIYSDSDQACGFDHACFRQDAGFGLLYYLVSRLRTGSFKEKEVNMTHDSIIS